MIKNLAIWNFFCPKSWQVFGHLKKFRNPFLLAKIFIFQLEETRNSPNPHFKLVFSNFLILIIILDKIIIHFKKKLTRTEYLYLKSELRLINGVQ
jgi:hypothetical protein